MKLHLPCKLLAAVLAFFSLATTYTLAADTISINFGTKDDNTSTCGATGSLGKVDASLWYDATTSGTGDFLYSAITDSSGSNAAILDMTLEQAAWGKNWRGNSNALQQVIADSYLDLGNGKTWTLNLQTDYMFSDVILYFAGDSGSYSLVNINDKAYVGTAQGAQEATNETSWGSRNATVAQGTADFTEGTNMMTYTGNSADTTGLYTISNAAITTPEIRATLAALQIVDRTADYLWTATGTELNATTTSFTLTGNEPTTIADMNEGARYIGLSDGQTLVLDTTAIDGIQATTGNSTITAASSLGTNGLLDISALFAKQGATLNLNGTLVANSDLTVGGLGTVIISQAQSLNTLKITGNLHIADNVSIEVSGDVNCGAFSSITGGSGASLFATLDAGEVYNHSGLTVSGDHAMKVDYFATLDEGTKIRAEDGTSITVTSSGGTLTVAQAADEESSAVTLSSLTITGGTTTLRATDGTTLTGSLGDMEQMHNASLTVGPGVALTYNKVNLGTATLTLQEGSSVSTTSFIASNGSHGRTSYVNIKGGLLEITGSAAAGEKKGDIRLAHWNGTTYINLSGGEFRALNAATGLGDDGKAIINITGGVMNVMGLASVGNNAINKPVSQVNLLSEGRLNIGSLGITDTNGYNTVALNLTGGTLGALEDWSSSLAMTVGSVTIDTTKYAQDAQGNWGYLSGDASGATITLSGALTAQDNTTMQVQGTGKLIIAGNITGTAAAVAVNSGTLQIGKAKTDTNTFHVPSITVSNGATLSLYHAVDTEGQTGAFEYEEGKYTDITLAGTLDSRDTSPDSPNENEKSLKLGTLTVDGENASLEGEYNARWQFAALTGDGKLTVKEFTNSKWHRYTHTFDILKDFNGTLQVDTTSPDTSLDVSKVYINGVSQANSKSATITGQTFSADGFVMGAKEGSATGSVTFDNHTAEGSFFVESGTLNASTLTLANGAVMELVGGTFNIGSGGIVKSGAEASVKLLGGTFGSINNAGFTTTADSPALTLGGVTLTGPITLGGAVEFVNAITNSGTLSITGAITVTSEGLSALANTSSASSSYSEGTNGFVNGAYTLITGTSGSTLNFGDGVYTKTITVAEAETQLVVENGNATFTLQGESGTYFVNQSATYDTAGQIAEADDIYVGSGQTLTFNNQNWDKDIDLAGASLVFNSGSMNNGADKTITLHSVDSNANGIYEDTELSENSITMYNSIMKHTVKGVGNLVLKQGVSDGGDVFYVHSSFEHVGNLTLTAGLAQIDQAYFNNEGTLRLESLSLSSARVGERVTGIELVNSTLTMEGTQGNAADLSYIAADDDSTLAVTLSGDMGEPAGGQSSLTLASDFAGTLDVKGGYLHYADTSLGKATINLGGGGILFQGTGTSHLRQEITNNIVVDAASTAYLTTWGSDNNSANNILSGAITGGGTIKKTDTGWVTLENISGFTGNFEVHAGTLTLNLGSDTFDATHMTISEGKVKLKGSGAYNVSGATEVMKHAEHLNVASDWTGTVKLTSNGIDASDAWLRLNNMGNANSTIELQGVVSYLNNLMNATATVVLNNTEDDKSAFKLYDGASDSEITFSGSVEGSGTFERATTSTVGNITLKFTGDVSRWDGQFLYTSAQNSPTTSVEFSRNATVVNAAIARHEDAPGTMKATFDNTGMANGMTVNSKITGDVDVTYKGSTTTSVTNTSSDYSGTTSVEGGAVVVKDGVNLGSGAVTVKDASLQLEGSKELSTLHVESGDTEVATLSGTNGSNATYAGVTISTTGISGGTLSGAEVTVNEDFALNGVTAENCTFTINDALTVGEGSSIGADTVVHIGATGSLLGHSGLTLNNQSNTLALDTEVAGSQVQFEVSATQLTIISTQLQGVENGHFILNFDADSAAQRMLDSLTMRSDLKFVFTTPNQAAGISTLATEGGEDVPSLFSSSTPSLSFSLGSSFTEYGYVAEDFVVSTMEDGSIQVEYKHPLGAIPEPTTATLSLLALAALAARRRRR